MAKSKAIKEQSVEQLTEELSRVKLAVLTDYRGLSVSELDRLRQELRAEDIPYRIVKNTLLRLALGQSPAHGDVNAAQLSGPMAVAFGFGDETSAARLVYKFAKDHQALEITGALSDNGRFLSPDEVKALALLPTKEQLLAHLCGTLSAPLAGLNRVLSGNISGLINVLKAQAAKG